MTDIDADRELLTLAAKAAGIEGLRFVPAFPGADEWDAGYPGHKYPDFRDHDTGEWLKAWNPLVDDGDALRLAVKLRIDLKLFYTDPDLWKPTGIAMAVVDRLRKALGVTVKDEDPYAATRRVIVRAAATIAESSTSRTANHQINMTSVFRS